MIKKIITTLFVCIIILCSTETRAQQCISGNCTNGVGTFDWENGDVYTGQFVNNELTGVGCFDWAKGTFYYGFLSAGVLNGIGIYLGLTREEDQFGLFENGKLVQNRAFAPGCIFGNCTNGVGVYLWENDDVYIGEWVEGNKTGYGRYDWSDGSNYIGYLKNGLLHGAGEYIKADKTRFAGQFIDNEFQQK